MMRGSGLGCESAIMPSLLLGVTLYLALVIADYYGLSLAIVGAVANMATGAAISSFAGMAKLCKGLNSLSKTTDAHGSTHCTLGTRTHTHTPGQYIYQNTPPVNTSIKTRFFFRYNRSTHFQ